MENNRSWMYQRTNDRGYLNPAFVKGLEEFMAYAKSRLSSMDGTNIKCPCWNCKNHRHWDADTVEFHLFKKGFVKDYYVWDRHDEPYIFGQTSGSADQSSTTNSNISCDREENNLMYDMVIDAAGPDFDPDRPEEMPNAEAQKLYDMLRSSEKKLYDGCEVSQLSAVAQMLSLKSDHHWSEACYDQTSQFFKDALPQDNTFIDSFYNTKKHMKGLGLPSIQIDCCVNGCMIYWSTDSEMISSYSMLSGWKTAGHLACPHCAHDHDAYNLSHGGKPTWFDNHRKFLPATHSFRKNKNWFTKGKTVTKLAPPIRSGEDVFKEIESFGLMKVTEVGSDEHNANIIKAYKCGWKKRTHNYVLFNCPEVAPYTQIFIMRLQQHNPNVRGAEIDKCLESDFALWFKDYAQNTSLVPNKFIRDLASGPLRSVKSVPIYYVNGYKFHTRKYGANKSTFNSGVCIKGTNYTETANDYFGIIEEILILEYPRLPIKRTVLFKCDWFDPTPNIGTKVHRCYNIVEVNQRKRLNLYEPFILAMQAVQVYFCGFPSLKRDKKDWLAVCKIKARALVDLPQISESRQEAFQDDMPGHLNMIDTENIPTSLNEEEGNVVDLDDDEVSSEEETQYESEVEGSSETDVTDDCEDYCDD
ncbi:hypothetical protein POM88_046629 [Heracleum sosnowskyi]|uniref:Transposase n=1 Tax=Heracleum sosnowskyi TaxID=360622 RepID=A0AAD8H9U4_9APIA|nr:hypothetical protein POM88_046629 [Heracleum sosnowskyi]